MADQNVLTAILAYHRRTKHHFHRYAPGPGFLDWATQPEPFRFYEDAPLMALTRKAYDRDERPWYDSIYGSLPPSPVDAESLASLLFHGFALSAWKSFSGSRWSLRCDPSSGNLHPTEVYLLSAAIPDLIDMPGLYHYNPWYHGLERRAEFPESVWSSLAGGLPQSVLLVGFTSIYWRESWKYGERALRYCLLDLGHAFAALSYGAACLGWKCAILPQVESTRLARLLGVAGQQGPEAEHPDCQVAVFPNGTVDWRAVAGWRLGEGVIAQLERTLRDDSPNRLSPTHRPWPIIGHAARAMCCERIEVSSVSQSEVKEAVKSRAVGARWLIRHRRSAQAMDGETVMHQADFARLLRRLMGGALPMGGLGREPCIHLGLLIHRVEGLTPGLYFLARSEAGLARFREASHEAWQWTPQRENLLFFRLREGDCRPLAKAFSCHQDIAAEGALAVSMLAEFEPRLCQSVWEYARLHLEAGALGQLLYLEAEAAGLRGTGIGCFFDDPVHELFGLKDESFQVLYHFTLGGGLEDKRLMTLEAYHHLEGT